MRGRELHEFILAQVQRRLSPRSWAWLAREADVPRSTLMTQKGRPRFSVEVLISLAEALNCDFGDLIPSHSRPPEREAAELLAELEAILLADTDDKRRSG